MTKTEMAVVIAKQTGLDNKLTYQVLSAIEQQLLTEGKALRAVELDNFGTFLPREKMGKRRGKIFNGSTIAYDNWKLVADPKLVAQATLLARAAKRAGIERANIEPDDLAQVLESYKTQVVRSLRRGMSVSSLVFGSYKVGKRKARVHKRADGSIGTQTPARLVVVFKSCKNGLHQKFIPVAGLVWGK
jgi:nucleoid DNA-binding protein